MVNQKRQNTIFVGGKGIEGRNWSDLPPDILNSIAERLDVVNQVYFRAVCKSWRETQINRRNEELPWLMGHSWAFNEDLFSVCSFYSPSASRAFISQNKIEGEEFKILHGAAICASKFGWLLFQKSSLSFFYNPYNNTIIRLPNLDLSFNRSTFSSVPTSPDCFCFAIQSSKSCNKIVLSICQPGDCQWRTFRFDGFERAVEDVVYSNGTFYCVFTGGLLGTFCLADCQWSLIATRQLNSEVHLESRAHMIESKGQLLLVCPCKFFKVFIFDWSLRSWVKINTLGCQALFLGCTSFSVPAEGDNFGFADRIYYNLDIFSYCYLLEARQSYQCSKSYPWNTERGTERVWIQPPKI